MARSLEGKLSEEADAKGLEGERRKAYIGGAWNRIRGREERSRWRHSREGELLSRHYGTIHEFREYKDPSRGVVFRQGQKWYHLPKAEYRNLVHYAEMEERETAAAQALIARERARDERRKLAAQQKQEREAKREARARQIEEEQQQREIQRFERVQHSDVVRIIRHAGGIRPSMEHATGRTHARGEIRDVIPSTLHARKGQGVTLDQAREAVDEQMPWLGLHTERDLLDFFDRARTYRRQHSRLADLWFSPAV